MEWLCLLQECVFLSVSGIALGNVSKQRDTPTQYGALPLGVSPFPVQLRRDRLPTSPGVMLRVICWLTQVDGWMSWLRARTHGGVIYI